MRRGATLTRLVVALSLVAGLASVARAQAVPEGTPEEVAGWQAIAAGKYVRARTLGEATLVRQPRSYAGHLVVGSALHYGEGDLARALPHFERAAELFESQYSATPPAAAPWRWHETTLREWASTLDELERPDEELAIFDRYDAAYTPKQVAQRVWPLLKLRRYDEARRFGRLACTSADSWDVVVARTALCALEIEAGDRASADAECHAGTAEFAARPGEADALYSNASLAARMVFHFDEAERLLVESSRRVVPVSYANPFMGLAWLYLGEGRIPESLEALQGGLELRLRRPPRMDQHEQARVDATLASVLLTVGETERAAAIAERAGRHPDRQGVHSGTEAQARAGSSLLLAVTLREAAERLEERAVTSSLARALLLRLEAAQLRLRAWTEERRVAVALADETLLVRTLRPQYSGGIDVAMWLHGELVRAVGAGVLLRALATARAAETDPRLRPIADAYVDAVEAEAELARGRCTAASVAVERALLRLPHAEALLEGRVAAIGAECARRQGQDERATTLFARALARDPDVLRRLGLALPVTVDDDGSEVGRRAARLVASSPRFFVRAAGGHALSLHATEACLLGPRRERIACVELDVAHRDVEPRAASQHLVDELHRVAFALKSDLSQADLTTLDGSPTAARADRQVRSLLDALGSDGEPGSPERTAPAAPR